MNLTKDKASFEEWSSINEEELNCIFSESGADRELCFDREREEEVLWVKSTGQ